MTLINRLRVVLLVLVLLSLLTVATTPSAMSAQANPRYVKLVSLKCVETEDSFGADEPYLTIGGITVWSGSMVEGQLVNLTGLPARQFYNQVNLSLYEDDVTDSDDWMGTSTVTERLVGTGNRTLHYHGGSGGFYELIYYAY